LVVRQAGGLKIVYAATMSITIGSDSLSIDLSTSQHRQALADLRRIIWSGCEVATGSDTTGLEEDSKAGCKPLVLSFR